MIPRVFVAGASGLLGSSWVNFIKPHCEVVGSLHSRQIATDGVSYYTIDYENSRQLRKLLKQSGTKILINCAGLTSVERCQTHPCLAAYSNIYIPERLAMSCSEMDIKMIHISSDHVFPGIKAMSTEKDSPAPVNIYAQTKLLGENKVLQLCPSALVVRTNFFGWGPPYRSSFSDMILNTLRSNKTVSLFSDAYFTPILMQTLIESVHKLIQQKESGIFHIVSSDRVSKYQFGLLIAKVFGFDRTLIKPSFLRERSDLTARPYDLSLSNSKFTDTTGTKIPSLEHQIHHLKETKTNC